jgi:hypothetical protein
VRVRMISMIGALMLVLAACSGSGDSESTTQPPSTTTITEDAESPLASDATSSTTTSTTTRDSEAEDQSTVLEPTREFVRQPLSDVSYVTSIMTPTIEFSGAGEWFFSGEFDPLLLLSLSTGTGGAQEQVLNFATFRTTEVDLAIAALKSDSALVFSGDEVPSTIGGIDGVALTATAVVPGGGFARSSIFPSNLFISQVALDPPILPDGWVFRFTVIPVGDVVVVAMVGSDATSFDDLLVAADALLSTVTFSG